MSTGPHVSLSAETVATIGNFHISNSIFTSLLVSIILIILALYVNKNLKTKGGPKGLQNVFELIIDALHTLTHDITQDKKNTKIIFPLATTFFLWIILNNWLGLIPGVGTIGVTEPSQTEIHADLIGSVHATQTSADDHGSAQDTTDTSSPVALESSHQSEDTSSSESDYHPTFIPLLRAGTADLNTTIALALIAMGSVQYIGIKRLGLGYFKKFFNFSNPINAFVGILETVSEFSKVISFSFRLFGNIFAGEVLLAVISFLIPIIAPIPFYGLEIFVGFIQALVFAMLTIVFMTIATMSHDADHH